MVSSARRLVCSATSWAQEGLWPLVWPSAQCLNLIDQAQVTHGPALNLILFNQLSLINSLPRRLMIKVMEGGTEPVAPDYHLNVQTNKLHPSDVDTPEPDEKSIITYVSQLYDVFPGNVLLTHS